MRSVLKIAELESRFPILAVENNCIVSKDGDITVAYEVELPELYTVTSAPCAGDTSSPRKSRTGMPW